MALRGRPPGQINIQTRTGSGSCPEIRFNMEKASGKTDSGEMIERSDIKIISLNLFLTVHNV